MTKLLKKQPDNRYQTAKDLLIDLRTLKEEQEFQLRLGRTPQPSGQLASGSAPAPTETVADRDSSAVQCERSAHAESTWARPSGFGVAALLVVAAGGWFAWRTANARSAKAKVAQVAAFAEAGRNAEAYDLAVAIEPYAAGRPHDRGPDASDLRHRLRDNRTGGGTGLPETIRSRARRRRPRRVGCWGLSPLSDVRIARGE